MAGGRENFRKFTGLNISDGTSMGISIAGEGYANFGWAGGEGRNGIRRGAQSFGKSHRGGVGCGVGDQVFLAGVGEGGVRLR